MKDSAPIMSLVNAHLARVLRVAESALPEGQFRAFRRMALDEFGRNGLERDLERLLGDRQDNNKYGNGLAHTARKGG